MYRIFTRLFAVFVHATIAAEYPFSVLETLMKNKGISLRNQQYLVSEEIVNDIPAGCSPIQLAKIDRHGRLKIMNQIHAVAGALVSFFMLASIATAAPITITVDTSSLSGTSAQLAFDLVDGGPPANSVTISGFGTNGTLGASSSTGDVVGNFPGSVVLSDTAFFNEYLQDITLGNTLSYTFDNTGLPADAASFPDGFSFFLLDPITGQSLTSTSDPTGANALFLLGIGTTSGFEIYSGQNFSVSVRGVPEPSSNLLLLVGVLFMFVAAWLFKYRSSTQHFLHGLINGGT